MKLIQLCFEHFNLWPFLPSFFIFFGHKRNLEQKYIEFNFPPPFSVFGDKEIPLQNRKTNLKRFVSFPWNLKPESPESSSFKFTNKEERRIQMIRFRETIKGDKTDKGILKVHQNLERSSKVSKVFWKPMDILNSTDIPGSFVPSKLFLGRFRSKSEVFFETITFSLPFLSSAQKFPKRRLFQIQWDSEAVEGGGGTTNFSRLKSVRFKI